MILPIYSSFQSALQSKELTVENGSEIVCGVGVIRSSLNATPVYWNGQLRFTVGGFTR